MLCFLYCFGGPINSCYRCAMCRIKRALLGKDDDGSLSDTIIFPYIQEKKRHEDILARVEKQDEEELTWSDNDDDSELKQEKDEKSDDIEQQEGKDSKADARLDNTNEVLKIEKSDTEKGFQYFYKYYIVQ